MGRLSCLRNIRRILFQSRFIKSHFLCTDAKASNVDSRCRRLALSENQYTQYEDNGYLVVNNLFSQDEVNAFITAATDLVQRSSKLTNSNDIFILSDEHSEDNPMLERVICPSLHHPTFAALIKNPKILDIVQDLIGPSFRYMPQDKLNAKPSTIGLPIPWHQDWAFFPHTNDSVVTVSVLIDESRKDNGCLQVIPGSHKGPLYDHFQNGCFSSAITDEQFNPDNSHYLEATAGSITLHHVRAVHGSAANSSDSPRRVVCFIYTSMDAWPLLGVAGRDFLNVGPVDWDLFNSTLLRGVPTASPRLTPCPVKLPLPLIGSTTVIGKFSKMQIPV